MVVDLATPRLNDINILAADAVFDFASARSKTLALLSLRMVADATACQACTFLQPQTC